MNLAAHPVNLYAPPRFLCACADESHAALGLSPSPKGDFHLAGYG